jgi:hypothetical protein
MGTNPRFAFRPAKRRGTSEAIRAPTDRTLSDKKRQTRIEGRAGGRFPGTESFSKWPKGLPFRGQIKTTIPRKRENRTIPQKILEKRPRVRYRRYSSRISTIRGGAPASSPQAPMRPAKRRLTFELPSTGSDPQHQSQGQRLAQRPPPPRASGGQSTLGPARHGRFPLALI